MKKVLLLLYIAVSVSGYSQTNFRFADSTAKWSELQWSINLDNGTNNYYTEKIKVIREHIFQNKQYQLIGSSSQVKYIIRVDSSQKAWSMMWWPNLIDTPERLMYDFGLLTGDTVRVFDWYVTRSYNVVCRVDSVNSIFWLRNRKRICLSCGQSLNTLNKKDVWIEGVGSLYYYLFHPGYDTIYTSPPNTIWIESLLCFEEQQQSLYQKPGFSICDADSTWNAIEDIEGSRVIISPNPATTYLTIQLQQSPATPMVFQLYDITGRMILQKPLTAQANTVELSGVSKGMYLYSVLRPVMVSLSNHQHNTERVGAGKLVVE